MTGNAPTNGNSRKNARIERNKQRSLLLTWKRVPKDRNQTKGGDAPIPRDRGRGR